MNQEKLTSEQAFNVLVQLANQVKLTLQEGEVAKQALQIIQELVVADIQSKQSKKTDVAEVAEVVETE